MSTAASRFALILTATAFVLGGPGVAFSQQSVPLTDVSERKRNTRIYADKRELDTPELVYRMIQVQKGDTLARLAAKYFWPVLEHLNKDEVTDPDLIYPGQWLLVPASRDTAVERTQGYRIADVAFATEGEAQFQYGSLKRVLKAGDELLDLGRVNTAAGFLTAVMGDGTVLRLLPNTSVDLNSLQIDEFGVWENESVLERGRVRFSQPQGEGRHTVYKLKLPVVDIEGESKNFSIEVDRKNYVRIEVYEHHLNVTIRGKHQRIYEGSGILINPTASKVVYAGLPNAPLGMQVKTHKGADVDFSWNGVPGASRYILTVSEDADMQEVAFRSTVYSGTSYSMKLYNPSHYYWTVVAVTGDGLHGPESPKHKFKQTR